MAMLETPSTLFLFMSYKSFEQLRMIVKFEHVSVECAEVSLSFHKSQIS